MGTNVLVSEKLFGVIEDKHIIEWLTIRDIKPLFLAVSGSHAWGLARPDSDLDIRGIYLDRTDRILSLYPGKDTIEALDQLGCGVDFQLYELKKALSMLLKYNGNIVELLLSPTCFFADLSWLWQPLARKFLTKKLSKYYEGYYHSQRKRAMDNRGGKALVYTFRELLTGIYLMRTGELIHNFHELIELGKHIWGDIPLLDEYMNREKWYVPMNAGEIWKFETEWNRLVELLHEETKNSLLPENYDGYNLLNSLLLEYRHDY